MLRRGTVKSSESLDAQLLVEKDTVRIYQSHVASGPEKIDDPFVLYRNRHLGYLTQGLSRPLPEGFISLGASKPWIVYWIVHSIGLLGELDSLSNDTRRTVIRFLAACQHRDGGFGGGPGQLPHVATTYAAVSALVTLGGENALSIIQRDNLLDFFLRMSVSKQDGGGMRMHQGGEIDVRGCYCALSVCHMLNMDVSRLADACDLGTFVMRCQSHEGGFGGEPGNESHGGYAFCAYAALELAGMQKVVDRNVLISWLSRMQGYIEGGMRGRTNKLVDGCYSLWQGGLCRILAENIKASQQDIKHTVDLSKCEHVIGRRIRSWIHSDHYIERSDMRDEELQRLQADFDRAIDDLIKAEEAFKNDTNASNKKIAAELGSIAMQIQDDIRELEQDVLARDVLSTLMPSMHSKNTTICDMISLQRWILLACQVEGRGGLRDKPETHTDFYHTCYCLSGLSAAQSLTDFVLGGENNRLLPTHPLCNVLSNKVEDSIRYFQ